jgi:hypothetical protein
MQTEHTPSGTELDVISEDDAESDPVLCWRLEQFSSLGFEPFDALLLSQSRADLHSARKLVAAGCALSVALQILL